MTIIKLIKKWIELTTQKKKYKLNNSLDKKPKKEYVINTTVNFGNTKRRYRVKATDLNDEKFNITKLEFEK